MKAISIHDAKTNLSKYIAAAKKGEKIYIGGFGKAEVVMTKLPPQDNREHERSFSFAQGKVVEKPGAFSAPTDEAIATIMYSD